MEKQDPKKLQKEVEARFKVIDGHGVGEYHHKGQAIHLDRIGLAKAEDLVKKGFVYLVPIDEKTEAKTVAVKTEEKKA